jgi:hypothetical protein
MTREINRTNFKNEPQVSCFTCHMGQPLPRSFPALPVAMAAPAKTNETAQSAAPAFPSGAAVIDRYIAVIGGESAIQRITNSVMTGKFVNAKGAKDRMNSSRFRLIRVANRPPSPAGTGSAVSATELDGNKVHSVPVIYCRNKYRIRSCHCRWCSTSS